MKDFFIWTAKKDMKTLVGIPVMYTTYPAVKLKSEKQIGFERDSNQ